MLSLHFVGTSYERILRRHTSLRPPFMLDNPRKIELLLLVVRVLTRSMLNLGYNWNWHIRGVDSALLLSVNGLNKRDLLTGLWYSIYTVFASKNPESTGTPLVLFCLLLAFLNASHRGAHDAYPGRRGPPLQHIPRMRPSQCRGRGRRP
jgi:hypothetical protein